MIASCSPKALPWLMLAMVAVSAAVLTMIGRLGFGPAQARVSRYVTFAVMLPIALLALSANGSFALDSFILRARPTSDQEPRPFSCLSRLSSWLAPSFLADLPALAGDSASRAFMERRLFPLSMSCLNQKDWPGMYFPTMAECKRPLTP